MGIIRNKVTLVHHWDFDKITKLRDDAIETFNKASSLFDIDIVGPIMTSPYNSEYTFMIQGDCSKCGWGMTDKFNDIRKEWYEKHKNDGIIVLVNLGEDGPAFIEFDSEGEN